MSEQVRVERKQIIIEGDGEDMAAVEYTPRLDDYHDRAVSIVASGFLRGAYSGGTADLIAQNVVRHTGGRVISFSPSGSYENKKRNNGYFTFPGFVEDIREVVEYVGDDWDINLIGYSMGGAACARFVLDALNEDPVYAINSLVLLQTPPEAAAHRSFKYAALLAAEEGKFLGEEVAGKENVIITPPGALQEYDELGSMREVLGGLICQTGALTKENTLYVYSDRDGRIHPKATKAFVEGVDGAEGMGEMITCSAVEDVRHDTAEPDAVERLMRPVFDSGVLGGIAVRAA